MTRSAEKRTERSVDSLQKVYAFVISLALVQAIQIVLVDRTTMDFIDVQTMLERAPAFVALLLVLVPFYHGMNRHLDVCYIENAEGQCAEAALLFDFVVFFVDSCLLFAVAYSIGHNLRPFAFLGILLGVDVVWSAISHFIHYTLTEVRSVKRWAVINGIAVGAGLFVGLNQWYAPASKAWLLLVIALSRTVCDYAFCWSFYFPKDAGGRPSEVLAFSDEAAR
jgi:hypothetical protein